MYICEKIYEMDIRENKKTKAGNLSEWITERIREKSFLHGL